VKLSVWIIDKISSGRNGIKSAYHCKRDWVRISIYFKRFKKRMQLLRSKFKSSTQKLHFTSTENDYYLKIDNKDYALGQQKNTSVFQPFLSRGTSQKFLIIWRNLNAPHSTIYSIFREPSKELGLKNTELEY